MKTAVVLAIATVVGVLSLPSLAGPTRPDDAPLPQPCIRDTMNNARLGHALSQLVENVQGGEGAWLLVAAGVQVMVVTDESHDRMRIIAPIADLADVPPEMLFESMKANFDRALDARYAINEGRIWSVFIHPLSSLNDSLLESALSQVVTAAQTFGTEFTSGGLVFGGQQREQPAAPPEVPGETRP